MRHGHRPADALNARRDASVAAPVPRASWPHALSSRWERACVFCGVGSSPWLVGLVDPKAEARMALGPVRGTQSAAIDEVSLHLAEGLEAAEGSGPGLEALAWATGLAATATAQASASAPGTVVGEVCVETWLFSLASAGDLSGGCPASALGSRRDGVRGALVRAPVVHSALIGAAGAVTAAAGSGSPAGPGGPAMSTRMGVPATRAHEPGVPPDPGRVPGHHSPLLAQAPHWPDG